MHLEQIEVDGFANAVCVLRQIRSEQLRIVEVHETVKRQDYGRLLANLTDIDGILSQLAPHRADDRL